MIATIRSCRTPAGGSRRWRASRASIGVAVLALRTGRYDLRGTSRRPVRRLEQARHAGGFYRGSPVRCADGPTSSSSTRAGPIRCSCSRQAADEDPGRPVEGTRRHHPGHGVLRPPVRRPDLHRHARAFPMRLAKVRIVGHGIDTRPSAAARGTQGDLIAVGRIAPTKRIEEMIAAVEPANRTYGTRTGSTSTARRCRAMRNTRPGRHADRPARSAGPGHPPRPGAHEHLPRLFNGHRAFLNFADHAPSTSLRSRPWRAGSR